jgi:DAK2 domain fusion protein YloV
VNREPLGTLLRAALQNLEAHRRRIDDLNVYPVPDGDTGTNLLLTLRGIVDAFERSSAEPDSELAKELSRGALMSARGNSGVIFSQIVRGLADVLGTGDEAHAQLLSRALRNASDAAYRAVRSPVEGTILTVIREMAEEGETEAALALPPAEFLAAVVARGEDALARTPTMLDVLGEAGVVDAGGAGLVEIARGVALALAGEPLPEAPVETERLGFEAVHQELSRYRYCTGFVVEGEELDIETLERQLDELGDSLLVVGDASALKVHVHTDDPGAALSLATRMGVIEEVEIANMHLQTAQREERLLEREPAGEAYETGLVVVAPGEGNRRLFESMGAARVIEGGQTMNPSAGEIVEAVESVPAPAVIVLPNNSNVVLSAEQAATLASKPVRVVPSTSVQAGFAAIVRFLSTSSPAENEAAMLEALASVSTGEVTIASREARLDGLAFAKGAYLGLVEGTAVASDDNLDAVATAVIERLLTDGRERLDIITGADAPPLDSLRSAIERRYPAIEVDVYEGGQQHYPLLLVAE